MSLQTKSRILFLLTMATGSSLFADSISSTCTDTKSATVYGSYGCSLQTTAGDTAISQITLSLSAAPGNYSVLTGTEQADSRLGNATATTMLTKDLVTAGPARQGLMFAVLTGGGSYFGDGAFASASVSLPFASITSLFASGMTCSAAIQNSCQNSAELQYFNPYAVTLGEQFTINYSGTAYSNYSSMAGSSGAVSDLSFSFRFTELDGTPVTVGAVAAAPEPSTFALIGMVLVFCLMRSKYTHRLINRTINTVVVSSL